MLFYLKFKFAQLRNLVLAFRESIIDFYFSLNQQAHNVRKIFKLVCTFEKIVESEKNVSRAKTR